MTLQAKSVEGEVIPHEITAYDPFRAELVELKKANEAAYFDYNTPDGNKQARSHVYKLRQSKSAIEKVRKEEKASSLEYGRKVDAEAKVIMNEIQEMIDVHMKPLEEIEQREEERKNRILARITEITEQSEKAATETSEEIETRLGFVRDIEVDDSFAEYKKSAQDAVNHALEVLPKILEDAKKKEQEALELERLRKEAAEREQKEREERIAQEAAEKARLQAEKEKEEAIEKERQRAKQEQEDRERQERQREADQKHRSSVHAQIIEALDALHFEREQAKALISALDNKAIPHIKIVY